MLYGFFSRDAGDSCFNSNQVGLMPNATSPPNPSPMLFQFQPGRINAAAVDVLEHAHARSNSNQVGLMRAWEACAKTIMKRFQFHPGRINASRPLAERASASRFQFQPGRINASSGSKPWARCQCFNSNQVGLMPAMTVGVEEASARVSIPTR